jgi:hypothetical protein
VNCSRHHAGIAQKNGYHGQTGKHPACVFMADFFKTSTIWVDFRYDGRARRWLKTFRANHDVPREMAPACVICMARVQRGSAKATEEEIQQYLRGRT